MFRNLVQINALFKKLTGSTHIATISEISKRLHSSQEYQSTTIINFNNIRPIPAVGFNDIRWLKDDLHLVVYGKTGCAIIHTISGHFKYQIDIEGIVNIFCPILNYDRVIVLDRYCNLWVPERSSSRRTHSNTVKQIITCSDAFFYTDSAETMFFALVLGVQSGYLVLYPKVDVASKDDLCRNLVPYKRIRVFQSDPFCVRFTSDAQMIVVLDNHHIMTLIKIKIDDKFSNSPWNEYVSTDLNSHISFIQKNKDVDKNFDPKLEEVKNNAAENLRVYHGFCIHL
ncbi:hypothetical protein ACOME3_001782 [Neoechinorhynchus agilis]